MFDMPKFVDYRFKFLHAVTWYCITKSQRKWVSPSKDAWLLGFFWFLWLFCSGKRKCRAEKLGCIRIWIPWNNRGIHSNSKTSDKALFTSLIHKQTNAAADTGTTVILIQWVFVLMHWPTRHKVEELEVMLEHNNCDHYMPINWLR